MKFSWRWMLDAIEGLEVPAAGAEVEAAARLHAEALTSVGMAVEGLEVLPDEDGAWDVVFDIEVTTNRPDAMCHRGLARELAVKLGARLRPLPPPPAAGGDVRSAAALRVEEGHAEVDHYLARVVRGVRVGPSPAWLERRLRSIGLRPIHNVVDVTNFVLWDLGQPIHAFDLDRIARDAEGRPRLEVRFARPGERLRTLDGAERALDPSVLTIADASGPIALAGIMGGASTEVSRRTTDILIESAHFGRRAVRQGARRLGMHTDASHRFERGTDPEGCAAAADRVAALVIEIAGGEALAGALEGRSHGEPASPGGGSGHARRKGRLALGDLRRFAGFAVEERTVERILPGLGFELEDDGRAAWRVTVPSWRHYDFPPDVSSPGEARSGQVYPADLYEEVLRHIGLDAVPSSLPELPGRDPEVAPAHAVRRRAQDVLAAAGYAEAINYAFVAPDEDATHAALVEGPAHRLLNPIAEGMAVMRRSLLPGLVASARFNVHRGAASVRLFETGHLFPAGSAVEVEALAWIAGGRLGTPWQGVHDLDVLDVKGVAERLAEALGAAIEARQEDLPGFEPGVAARLWRLGAVGEADEPVGHLGQIDAAVAGLQRPLFAAELRLDRLAARGERSGETSLPPVRIPSRYPAIEADLTLQHQAGVAWRDIEARALAGAPAELQALLLQDRYLGAGVPEGWVNTTLRAVYQANDRSLTQDEVNDAHRGLAERLAPLGRRV